MLTAGGLVERRCSVRLRLIGHAMAVEATVTATGEHGLVEGFEPVVKAAWQAWAGEYLRGKAGGPADQPTFHCEPLGPQEARLSKEGQQARADVEAGQSRMVLDFLHKRAPVFAGKVVRGYRIVGEYTDDAISGTSAEQRPGFQKMIADAPAGGFKAVIVWNSDRFSRGDVTETEHYRYLLRKAGVTLLSVTEDYLAREGIDGDVLRTVKQFQNRQYSISLSQNTLRGQISSVMAASDPGRPCPYGYDREIVGPDGEPLYRVRFCPGGVREVNGRDGRLQAKYAKGQELSKPGKECKARLVLSTPERVQTVRDIFGLFTDGMGYKSIADELNRRGVPSPRKDFWSFTTIKSLLANPVYQGDLVWNRRTEAKFYAVRQGRADKMRPSQESARVTLTRREDWIVIPDAVPAIVDRATWQKAQAQVQVAKRPAARGGIGHRNRCWLLTGVLQCGDCGHKYWGEPKKKGRIEGRAPVVTNYYTCAGRRTHGKLICPTPAHVRAEELEGWVLGKLERLVMGDAGGTSYALDRIVATLMGEDGSTGEVERIEGELGKVRETVAALTASIDPANLALLNDRLTQLRLRKEHLEQELAAAKLAGHGRDEGEIRRWAERQLAGLADALDGRRDDETRRVLGSYVDRITLWPSTKRGEMALADDLWPLLCPEKQHDRPEGRSCGNQIAGARSRTSWQTHTRPADLPGSDPQIVRGSDPLHTVLPLAGAGHWLFDHRLAASSRFTMPPGPPRGRPNARRLPLGHSMVARPAWPVSCRAPAS